MDEAERREIARKGGRAAHQQGRAHEWTQEEAREAGRKGGSVLLRSGDESAGPRAEGSVAAALDDIATALDRASNDRGFAPRTHVIDSMRQSIAKAAAALDRIANRVP